MDPLTMSMIAGGASAAGGFLGKMFGGSSGSDDLSDAMYAATAESKRQYEDVKKMYEPYRTAGVTELPLMTTEANAPLGSNPLYQWRLQQGQRSLDQYLSSKGLLGSGAGVSATSNLVGSLTGEETDKQFGRQQVLANLGLAGTQGTSNAATSTGANNANIIMSAGQGQAAIQNQQLRDTSSLFSQAGGIAGGMLGKYASNQQMLEWMKNNPWGGGYTGFDTMAVPFG